MSNEKVERAHRTINIEAAASIASRLLGTGTTNRTAEEMAAQLAKDAKKAAKK